MIKYLKKLWKKCFGSVGYSRIKEVRSTPAALPVLILKPKHCVTHTRFKKSCQACQEIIK
jgi:hypothetical protein